MSPGPSKPCPVCGARLPVGALRGHVGSTRCMHTLHCDRDGKCVDEWRGPAALSLAAELEKLVRATPAQEGS